VNSEEIRVDPSTDAASGHTIASGHHKQEIHLLNFAVRIGSQARCATKLSEGIALVHRCLRSDLIGLAAG
jgi:hypothetical protein